MEENLIINDLLNAKEGEHVQFKEAKTRFSFNEATQICCALANCGGGKLVLGITDNRPRQIVGSSAFAQPERTRKNLIDKLKVMVDFELHNYEEKRILVFDVASRPLGLPVQVEGIAWWYEGDSLITMPENIRRNIYEETGFDFSGSVCPPAKFSDLDVDAVEIFRKKWVEKSGNKRLETYTAEQLLRDCEAITEEGITYAALILFGKYTSLRKCLPQAEIIFEYRSSDASGPANQREEFREGFFACYDRIWELINLRNDKQHYQEGMYVFDIPTFNERVTREAILNAVSHRNYQMGGSIFVRQYKDRLVIESPGGFPSGISLENILDRQSPRNRRVAEILSLCGMVERSGQGMNIIFENSIIEAKQLPDFTGTDENFVCIALNGLILDKNMISVVNRIGEEQLETLSTGDFLVINALYHGQELSQNLLSRLNKLVEIGLVERASSSEYILAQKLYSADGTTGVHTRKVVLDREANKELLLKHIQENGNKGTPLRELLQVLPEKTPGQVQVFMRELREEGRIYFRGKTRGALWYAMDKSEQ